MNKEKVFKSYAVLRAGVLGNNLLEAYFPYFANIIIENKYEIIDEVEIQKKFKEKYTIDVPATFVRQVLSVGLKGKLIMAHKGRYKANLSKLIKLGFDDTAFHNDWDKLIKSFTEFLKESDAELEKDSIENDIIIFINEQDQHVILNNLNNNSDNCFNYYWCKFLIEEQEKNDMHGNYNFIAGLCAGNLVKDALFYAGEKACRYDGLCVFLDSPMIFALLGIDTKAREDSYKLLVEEMLTIGCKVSIFDHNLQEVLSILEGAASWAKSKNYDMSKASNAAKYFHDSDMTYVEIDEFIDSVETTLNSFGISVTLGIYDKLENRFQEDENRIYEMIETRYRANNLTFNNTEYEQKIKVDVRSIVMVYRRRAGNISTKIQTAHYILITTNNTIANVSKEYEIEQNNNNGHIPACISADFFGTIIWLQKPAKMLDYQKKRLLADCYCALQPTRKMLDQFSKSLEKALNEDAIDETKFYFLRAHPVVRDSIMNVTKGDYALFSDQTWVEVYDEIQSQATNLYKQEACKHEDTRNELEIERRKCLDLENELKNKEAIEEEKKNRDLSNKTNVLGWLFTIILCGIPITVIISIIEIIQSQFNEVTITAVIAIICFSLLTIFSKKLFYIGKKHCFSLSQKILTNRIKKKDITE